MKYIPLFLLIQLINIPLMVLGWFIVALCVTATRRGWLRDWPHWAWLWFNDEDGYGTIPGWWGAFDWLALRNPVANLRHVRGVSKVGRPLYYRTWLVKGRQFYVKAGWMSDGYPACSAGAGRGY